VENNIIEMPKRQSIDFYKIKNLNLEIQKLIEERPELQELQNEINKALSKAGKNRINRNVVISTMMINSFKTLADKLSKLQKS
jgi:hypothetical protein